MLDFKTGAFWKLVNTVFLLWGAWGSQGDTRAYRVQLSREDIIVGIQYAMADSMSNSASMKEHIVIVRIHRAFAFGSYLLESSCSSSLASSDQQAGALLAFEQLLRRREKGRSARYESCRVK